VDLKLFNSQIEFYHCYNIAFPDIVANFARLNNGAQYSDKNCVSSL